MLNPAGTGRRPLVVAHRGASGYRPEHTLAAYALAIEQGADYIEPDLVSTKDGVLVAQHESEIGRTTDVADRDEFADRRTTKVIDGTEQLGWFTEDFTLAELKTLRTRERLPQVRPGNRQFDGRYEIATLDEVLDLAAGARTRGGERVGVYPETKNPTYFRSIGLPLEEQLVGSLQRHGFDEEAPVFVQSFETSNLKELAASTDYRLIQLFERVGAPYDLVSTGDSRSYADLATEEGLREISSYAFGVGLPKPLIISRDGAGSLLGSTGVTDTAHRLGLEVHGFTFRQENAFLPLEYQRGSDPAQAGDLAGEIDAYVQAGVDGIFLDNPDLADAALELSRAS